MSKKPTSPETLYGTGRDYLREQIKTNEILADIAGVEYTPPEGVPKGKYMENKWLLDAAEKKNELLEEIAEGGPGGGSAAAKAIGIDYATDGIFLKNKNGDTIQGSGATLPAYGVTFDPATGGLTLTKNGTAVQGQTVTIPNYGSPVGVDASADMTDHDKIYLYLGTTGGGLTNGHFYYWDGSAWADGGEYAAATVQTDKTLLVEDRAADAKATGDAVNSLKTQIKDIYKAETNLVDTSDLIIGKAVTSTGSLADLDIAFVTGLIPIGNASKIYIRDGLLQSSRYGHYFYNETLGSVEFVSCETVAETRIIDVPTGAKYLRATGIIGNENKITIGIIEEYEKVPVGITDTVYIENATLETNTVILNYTDIIPGERIFYNLEAIANKYAYLTVVHKDNSATHYGKTSSSMTAKFYTGEILIPNDFAYLKWESNDENNRIVYLGKMPKYAYDDIIFKKAEYGIYPTALRDDGYGQADLSYAFSARNIYIPNGYTAKISTNDAFRIYVHKYNEYGEHTSLETYNNYAIIKADANIWININILAIDISTTFSDNYESLSGLVIVSDYIPQIKENSGALLSRTALEPDVPNRYCRIPMMEVMPNKKVLCLFDSRQSLSDASDQYIAYKIINSQNAVEKSGILEQKAENVYRQNECMSFTLSNGDIGVLFTNILVNDTGESELHYIVSHDYGDTWGDSVVIDATPSGYQLFVAPSTKPVNMGNDVFMIPVWKREADDRVGTSYQSGIMIFNALTLTHTEKYVPAGDINNECNVWLNEDNTTVILCCRREGDARRYFYKIDTGLTGEFVALTHYLDVSSWMRPVCQEGTYKKDKILIISRQTNTSARNSQKLFCSDSLGRKSISVFDTIEGITTAGYSCVEVSDNIVYILSEGADKILPNGKCLFLDRIYVNGIA